MKKIAIVVPNNLWVCPYVSIYMRVFDTLGVSYETISWNRDGRAENGIQYNKQEKSRNLLRVLFSYIMFAQFVKKTIKKNKYDRLIIFTPQLGIFLASFLQKNYKNRYIFDYRDLSIEQKPFFKKPFVKLLSNSYANVISSPGFKKYLPGGFDFILSHNFNVELVKKALACDEKHYQGKGISVLTIGAIRVDCNYEVIDALGNKEGISLAFIGKGDAAPELEEYAKTKGYSNVRFEGYYKKEEEPSIYRSFAVVNIIYPQIPSHQTAVSNRFYNSLIYKRPMLVTKNSTQGDYAEQYHVGLAVEDCDNLAEKLKTYLKSLDFNSYCKQCNNLLETFLEDQNKLESQINNFIK